MLLADPEEVVDCVVHDLHHLLADELLVPLVHRQLYIIISKHLEDQPNRKKHCSRHRTERIAKASLQYFRVVLWLVIKMDVAFFYYFSSFTSRDN